jgi:hypothetical protein
MARVIYIILFVVPTVIAGIVVFFDLGDPKDPLPWWFWALVTAIVVLSIIIASLAKRGHRIELNAKPRIGIQFVPGDLGFEETGPKNADGLARRLFRISIQNLGGEVVKNCSVKMVSMVDANGVHSAYPGIHFKRRHDNPPDVINRPHEQSFDIRPNDHEDIDIVELEEKTPNSMLVMKYALKGHSSMTVNNCLPRTFCPQSLTLKVVADNSMPVEESFQFYVDDAGYLRFERQ